MNTVPSDTMIRAWARLQRAQQDALTGIETALKGAGLPALSWYDVLLELERVRDKGLRPMELERRMLLPQHGISRLIDRMTAAGYLERKPCADDGRGHFVVATKAGKALRAKMWPVYSGAIAGTIGSKLTDREAATLDKLLGKIMEAT